MSRGSYQGVRVLSGGGAQFFSGDGSSFLGRINLKIRYVFMTKFYHVFPKRIKLQFKIKFEKALVPIASAQQYTITILFKYVLHIFLRYYAHSY